MISTVKPMPRSIMLECGPAFFGSKAPAAKIKALAAKALDKHGIGLDVLIYDRQPRLEHTNRNVGGLYTATDDIEALFRLLNDTGHPFNLALNGSPSYFRHVPLDPNELKCLKNLQESGDRNGIRNSVTIADNELLPGIRERFPGLSVIASCISAAYEPNLVDFSAFRGIGFQNPKYYLKYYRYLYSIYDMVVPLPQLLTPAFFSALGMPAEELAEKSILFINLGCGAQQIRCCVEHYSGMTNKVRNDLPVIPDSYIVKPEDEFVGWKACPFSFSSQGLMYRFGDLRTLLEAGFHKFKIPARMSDINGTADFLSNFITLGPSPDSMPEKPNIWGYTPADMKLSLIKSYPARVHHILHGYTWPPFDTDNYGAYCGHTAYEIEKELHWLAIEADAKNQ